MVASVEMPGNWDDHAAWEAYYNALPSDEFWYKSAISDSGSFRFDELGSLIDDFIDRGWTTLWFPGCGFSPLPRAFALFGFKVYATDIAPGAIQYQQSNESIVERLVAGVRSEKQRQQQGCLRQQIHDFRESFGDGTVDAIFNVKSIQGLPHSSLTRAIHSHFAALRAGGIVFFDTMNVQGERRDQLEEALVDAGFYVPLHALNKWYRKSLTDTGIPHVFVLGAPMIPQRDDYPYPHTFGSAEYERDVQILSDITSEFRSRAETEYQGEQATVHEQAKRAYVIYSTG